MTIAGQIIDVLQGVLIHQRARWGPLLGHSQYEGWWKAELASALASWCWSDAAPDPRLEVVFEPRQSRALPTAPKGLADLLVAPSTPDGVDIDCELPGPHVWIEVKERGWWWKQPDRALAGLRADLEKWRHVDWPPDHIVLVAHILGYPAGDEGTLDPLWREPLLALRPTASRAVGYPVHAPDGQHIRWARLDVFQVAGA
jgi:hypothetical protein